MARPSPTTGVLALAAAIVLTAGLATAFADFTVYTNDFNSHSEFKEIIRSGGGKACDRRYRKKSGSMVASLKKGNRTCSFRPPVQGDGQLPNQTVTLDGSILKKTPKSIRGGAFIEITVRAGGGDSGYTLRVFPHKHRFQLLRTPGGGGFPVTGKDKKIKRIGDRNKLTLAARGGKITASVNGKELASVEDTNPGQVTGSKIRFAVGNRKKKSKPVIAVFKRIAVAVP
jgi:hypothetical protein